MSGELLREAARLMRERAEAVTSGGQWTGGHYWITDYDPSDPTGQTAMQRLIGGMDSPDCDHYSAWPPPVALAVAELLDTAPDTGSSSITYHAAVAVARAYLGVPS